MSARLSLETIEIASPCNASWDEMSGTERVRFCRECQLQVYNLSGMGAEEAEAFLDKVRGPGRTCVRFFRRQDGTILTRDCPVGLRLLRRVSAGLVVTLAACAVFLLALVGVSSFAALRSWLPAWAQPGPGAGPGGPGGGFVMGEPCVPPGIGPPGEEPDEEVLPEMPAEIGKDE